MTKKIGGCSFEPRNDKAVGSHEKFRRNKNGFYLGFQLEHSTKET